MSINMKKTISCFDSDADPYITQKDVILCRSGIQYYHKSELQAFMADGNMPKEDKEWYREYRPASVVVKAKKLCSSLPVTKEHPSVWVTPKNWKELAGGTTDREVEVVALDGESEGEIGLKSSLTFYDEDLYDYYEKNNKEVSVGYTCKKHWVDNPEEVGYDLVLDEITEVNHLAITRAGRGGSSVAVIDSLLGGMKPMRTGIFAWLASKMQKDSAPVSFGKTVFASLKDSKGTTEEELAGEMKGVLDSCAILKDCEAKDTLMDAVRDCFDHKDKALANEESLTAELDSMYAVASDESLKGFAKDSDEKKEDEAKTEDACDEEKKEEKAEDACSDEKKEDEAKDACSDEKKEEEEKAEDSEEKTEEKEEGKETAKDSMPELTQETVQNMIKDSLNGDALKGLILDTVKECLGLKEAKKTLIEGSELDSATKGADVTRDYTDFLE